MAHPLKDETLKFAIRGVVVVGLVGEVDDAGFVSGVLRKEEEVDEERGLLSEISCYGGGDSNDVAYEVAEGEVGVEESFVNSVGVGTDLVEGKGLAMVHDHPGGGRGIFCSKERRRKRKRITHLVSTPLGQPIDNMFLHSLLSLQMRRQNLPQNRCSLHRSLSQFPFVARQNVKTLVDEQD